MQNRRVGAALIILFFSGALYLVGQFINGAREYSFIGAGVEPQTTVSVAGEGEVFAVPDIAQFSFSVRKEAKTMMEAQKLSAEKMNEVLAFLKESGIEEKDIKTQNYSAGPRYEWQQSAQVICRDGYCPPQGKQVLIGYEVSQTISVKVRSTDKAGEILSGAGEKGATDLSGIEFTIDDEEKLKREARQKAIADAEVKANELAGDLGVKLVRVVSFSESGTPVYPMFSKLQAADSREMAGAVAPEIPVGENKIVSNVTIVYEIR